MHKGAICLFALSLIVPMGANAASSPQKPGKWQMSTEMEIPNMPVKMPSVTMTMCVSKDDVDNPEKSFPKASGDKNASCKYSDYKVEKNTVSYDVKCEGKHPMTGSGTMTYSGDTFEGSMKMDMEGTKLTTNYKGKWLGECDGTEMNAKKK